MGLAAGVTAGAMSTVWQNATETEVYAASLLLSVALIVAADRAGRTGERRYTILTAYLLASGGPVAPQRSRRGSGRGVARVGATRR